MTERKKNKMSREGKKALASFVLISELCTKTPGHPSVALAGPLSPRDLVGEGNSLSLEKPASCSVVEVKSTTPKNSWTSPENQHHPLAQIFTVYKTLSCTFSSLTFTKHQ